MFRILLVIVASATLLLAFPLAAQNDRYSAEDIEQLRTDIQKILDEDKIPGASVALVSREGTIWAGGVGKSNVAADKDVTDKTLFRVGSISKSFTALSLLSLVEKGLLDLNTPVRDIAPEIEFTNPWSDTDPVTLAMTMEHTTGFDDIRFREYAKVDDPDMTLEQGLAYNPSSRVSRWRPGTHMSYCNSGPPIAAFVLQKVTGQEYQDYAREHVFGPLGMKSSYDFPVEADLLAKGYEGDGETEAHYDHIIVRPSGSLNASSADMGNYLEMMINRGNFRGRQLFKPETITRMETPTTTLAAKAGFDFGYGLGNYNSVVAGHRFHGHDGGITGFVSTSAYSSELGLGFFVSINKASMKLMDIAKLVGQFLTADLIATEPPVVELSNAQLDKVTGYYQNVTPRAQIMNVAMRFFSIQRITNEDGGLFKTGLFGGEKKEIFPVSENSFRTEKQPVATLFLVGNNDGDVFLQGDMGVGNSQQISAFWAWFQIIAAVLVILLMVSAIVFALIWIPGKIFGKLQSVPVTDVLPPFLATFSLVATIVLSVLLFSDMIVSLGARSPVSSTIFLGTLLFAVLTLYALYRIWHSETPRLGTKVRVHSLLVALACLSALLYLWDNDIIGLRTWAY